MPIFGSYHKFRERRFPKRAGEGPLVLRLSRLERGWISALKYRNTQPKGCGKLPLRPRTGRSQALLEPVHVHRQRAEGVAEGAGFKGE